MNEKIANLLRYRFNCSRRKKLDKEYAIRLKLSGVPNKAAKGEEIWKKKWSVFGEPLNVNYYRNYSILFKS